MMAVTIAETAVMRMGLYCTATHCRCTVLQPTVCVLYCNPLYVYCTTVQVRAAALHQRPVPLPAGRLRQAAAPNIRLGDGNMEIKSQIDMFSLLDIWWGGAAGSGCVTGTPTVRAGRTKRNAGDL